jgi:hypothetical protein
MIFARGLCFPGILIVWLFVIDFFARTGKSEFVDCEFVDLTIFTRELCISDILIVWLFIIFAGPGKCDFAE